MQSVYSRISLHLRLFGKDSCTQKKENENKKQDKEVRAVCQQRAPDVKDIQISA